MSFLFHFNRFFSFFRSFDLFLLNNHNNTYALCQYKKFRKVIFYINNKQMTPFWDFLPDQIPLGIKNFIYVMLLLHFFAIVCLFKYYL